MARRKRSNLPKWRQKANWLLRELARIWYGKTEPYPLFKDRNFVKAFIDIMVQHFWDCYDEDDAALMLEIITEEYGVESIEQLLKSYYSYTTQSHEAWDVLIRALRFIHKRPFLYGRIITDILWMAQQIENRLKSGRKPPYKPEKRIRDLSWYENLPCLPID